MMNLKYYAMAPTYFFGGPVNINILEYQVLRSEFLGFWHDQMKWSNVSFKYKPFGSNPFEDVLFVSKGKYDIANNNNGFGSNFLFVSNRMLEIFKTLKVPNYEIYPVKYRQRGNIYYGYFIAFLNDYTNYIDFENSLIYYKPYKYQHYMPIKFQSGEDFSAFIRENASIKHNDGSTNLGSFRYPHLRFLDFVYEMDLLNIPFLFYNFLISEKLKNIFEEVKIKGIKVLDVMGTHYKFDSGVLELDPIGTF